MVTVDGRRTRKRLATRQNISDAATRLFLERGFDSVTVDEIAAEADVGRMTVFNHFPRKEDMFFDREDEIRSIAFEAVRGRRPDVSPIEALRKLAHDLVRHDHEFVKLSDKKIWFIKTATNSEALKSRAREMRDNFTSGLAVLLAETARRPADDPNAHLAAALIVATWSVAFSEAHALFDRKRDQSKSNRRFLAIIDRGIAAVAAALVKTSYV